MPTGLTKPLPLLDTLGLVAKVLQEEHEPATSLRTLAEIIRKYSDADDAKVFVVQRGESGPGLEQLCRTDEDMEKFNRAIVPISEELGLANWVVLHNDWLAVPQVPREWPKEETAFSVQTGAHGEVTLHARHERDFIEAKEDQEATLLMVPLQAADRTAGVLAVWRDRPVDPETAPPPAPFSIPEDPMELLKLAPFVAASCQQVLQRRVLEDELRAVSELAEALHQASTLVDAYGAVAKGVGTFADAPCAILLHHDPDSPGQLYHRCTWTDPASNAFGVQEFFRGLHIACEANDEHWKDRIREVVEERLLEHEDLSWEISSRRIYGPTEGRLPEIVVVLLDRATSAPDPGFFADDLRARAARSFLSYARSMLHNHIQTYSQRLVDDLGRAEGAASWSPDQVLAEAAEMLRKATAASGSLVYSGPGGSFSVTSTSPECEELMGLGVTPDSLTQKSIDEERPRRVVDTGDPGESGAQEMDRKRLGEIRGAFGWTDLRSWLACPVLDRGRCVGVLKLLTADRDSFLGKDHEDLAVAVTDRAAWEIRKLNRRLMLEELNAVANELTRKRGIELGKLMVEKLEEWTARFLRPGVRIAVLTRTSDDRPLINRASESIDQDLVEGLKRLSRHWGRTVQTWQRKGNLAIASKEKIRVPQPGVAVPITLPAEVSLEGHLVLLHPDAFTQEEIEAAREASREIGVVLHSERMMRLWKERAGRFRHAVLGPVQGLTSAAMELTERVEESNAPTVEEEGDVQEIRRQIQEEAELIRIWRFNQRLYLSERVEVQLRYQPLRRLFERCINRYRPILESRDIKIREEWHPYGQVRFRFDEPGIDLVLSNLLHNAAKYAFYHTEITVGVRVQEGWVHISVEDIGHPIPDRLDEEIYMTAERLDWDDPFRTIEGQGLGLPMAKAIVEAHDGRIYHTSERWLSGTKTETTPYKVRFTVELPTEFSGLKG